MVWDHVLWCDIVYAYGAVWYLVLWDCGMMWCGDVVYYDFGVRYWSGGMVVYCGVVLVVLWYGRVWCCGSSIVLHSFVVVMQYGVIGVV